LVEFQPDTDPQTTGGGVFLAEPQWPDFQPHDPAYFRRQLDHLEDYWETVSGGEAGFSVDLDTRVHRLSDPLSRYGEDDDSLQRMAELLRDAISAADPDLDFSPYDAVMVIHAGLGQESDLALDTPSDIWSSYISAADLEEELDLATGIETDDGAIVSAGIIVPEMETQDAADEDPSKILATLGVMAFETGHFFGLPDLFDTGPAPQDSWGIGSWGIMGLGAWNANGFVPPHPCAWSKRRLGWATAQPIASGDTLSLAPIEAHPATLLSARISPSDLFLIAYRKGDLNDNGCYDFLDADGDSIFSYFDPLSGDRYLGSEFDYYLPTGSGAPCDGSSSGVLIWHVDDDVIAVSAPLDINQVNAEAGRKGVDLEEAGGVQNLDQYPGSWGDPGDFWNPGTTFGPDTQPDTRTNSGARSGWAFTVDAVSPEAAILHATIEASQAGWPLTIAEPLIGDLLAADFDLDGAADVIALGASGQLHLIWGGVRSSTPQPLLDPADEQAAGCAAADLDRDGAPDLLVTTRDGRVLALRLADSEGTRYSTSFPPLLSGSWGQSRGAAFSLDPAIADLDGDSEPEIVVFPLAQPPPEESTPPQILLLSAAGHELARITAAGPVSVPPAITADGRIAVFAGDRLTLYQWIRAVGFRPLTSRAILATVSTPLLAIDIDHDGSEEILLMAEEGIAHLFTAELEEPPGWPLHLDAGLATPAAVADLGNDDRIDLIALTHDPLELHRWDRAGDGIPDWRNPRLATSSDALIIPRAGLLCGDLDADGIDEIVSALPTGIIKAISPGESGTANQTTSGFPLQASGDVSYTPLLVDLDADGDLELVVPTDGGPIMAWDFAATRTPTWAQRGGGAARSGRYTGAYPTDPPPTATLLDQAYLYPNPARDHARLHYRLGGTATAVTIRVLNVRGEELSMTTIRDPYLLTAGDQHWEWPVSSLARGIYYLLIEVQGPSSKARATIKAALLGECCD
jgi:M6 family metalloprotease-like protein